MKRSFVLALVVACALAGVTAAAVLADDGTPTTGTVSTDTTTTATTTTPTTTTTTTTTAVPTPPRAPRRIAVRVTVGGVPVGGLTPADAVVAVRAGFSTPLRLVYGRYRVAADPGRLGAIGLAQQAVGRARTARPGTHVKLAVSVRPGPLRSYLRRIATRIDRAPVDSTLVLRGTRPYISPDRNGTRLDVERALRTISARLRAGKRGAVSLPARVLAPAATRASFGAIVVIRRGANRLELFDGMRSVRTFGVATGQSQYPTPLGSFQIVVKWTNPWWYPPASPWAVGEKPTPPGPGNPLGTRWMGISSPGVGIHGTPSDGSIGYSLSHGCIRMHIPEAEWLFDHVEVGTPVYIVAA